MKRVIGAALAATFLTWAGAASAAPTVITFDDGEAQISEPLVTHGVHFQAGWTKLTPGPDRTAIGWNRILPNIDGFPGGGAGTFDLVSIQLKIVDPTPLPGPVSLIFTYWGAGADTGQKSVNVAVSDDIYTSFQTIDLSWIGAVRAFEWGFGGVDKINTPSSPCWEGCIYSDTYTLADNLIVDNIAPDATLSAIPEPATWAMMIVGFGLAGSVLRRRRTLVAA